MKHWRNAYFLKVAWTRNKHLVLSKSKLQLEGICDHCMKEQHLVYFWMVVTQWESWCINTAVYKSHRLSSGKYLNSEKGVEENTTSLMVLLSILENVFKMSSAKL